MTRGMNMGNRKVDNERAANLGKVGKEPSAVKETPVDVECPLAWRPTTLCVARRPAMLVSRGFALHLRIGRARMPGSGDEVVV